MTPLLEGKVQLLSHHFDRGIVRKLEVVDTGHHRWQEVVGVLGRLDCLADDGQRRTQGLEAWEGGREREGWRAQCLYVCTVEPLYCGHLGDLVKCPV